MFNAPIILVPVCLILNIEMQCIDSHEVKWKFWAQGQVINKTFDLLCHENFLYITMVITLKAPGTAFQAVDKRRDKREQVVDTREEVSPQKLPCCDHSHRLLALISLRPKLSKPLIPHLSMIDLDFPKIYPPCLT